ncbi:hypothetical protein [Pimelobacter simplex]|uniref:hypothetical protein n=1 Tax=Nocardioides simplex TaxID=2045 RepID=UPI003AAF8804
MMRKALGAITALALLGALTACGGGNDGASPEARPADEPTSDLRLKDACPLIEQALLDTGANTGGRDEIAAFTREALDLYARSEAEAQAALEGLVQASSQYGQGGVDGVVAEQAEFSNALDELAAECKAVGSSALQ